MLDIDPGLFWCVVHHAKRNPHASFKFLADQEILVVALRRGDGDVPEKKLPVLGFAGLGNRTGILGLIRFRLRRHSGFLALPWFLKRCCHLVLLGFLQIRDVRPYAGSAGGRQPQGIVRRVDVQLIGVAA